MRRIIGITIVVVFGWLLFKKMFAKSQTEVDDSYDTAIDGRDRGFVAQFWNLFRNPPVAQIGSRPLVTASVNPFSGGSVGYPAPTTTLPKFVGLDAAASVVRSIFNFNGTPAATSDGQVPNETIVPLDEFAVPSSWTGWENN
jgi:hypothetical protein